VTPRGVSPRMDKIVTIWRRFDYFSDLLLNHLDCTWMKLYITVLRGFKIKICGDLPFTMVSRNDKNGNLL
jgi:hypothetical protein